MALNQVSNPNDVAYNINSAMDVLLSKLDEAIEDMENGRVLDIEEVWKKIDAI